MRLCSFLLLIFFHFVTILEAGDHAALLTQHWNQQKQTQTNSITIRAWPLANTRVTFSPDRNFLGEIYPAYDQLASTVAIFDYRVKEVRRSSGTLQAGSVSKLQVYGRGTPFESGSANIVFLIRGNTVFVFPRVMLMHPAIKRIKLGPNDRVASARVDANKIQVKPEQFHAEIKSDVYLKYVLHLFEQKDLLPGSKATVIPRIPLRGIDNTKTLETGDKLGVSIRLEYDDVLSDQYQDRLDTRVPLYVLNRRLGPIFFKVLCPNLKLGFFQEKGALMKSLSTRDRATPDENPDSAARELRRWLVESNVGLVNLIDGDVVEITELELFLLANRLLTP